MNSQDFRNLQESYLNVYEQEEVLDEITGGKGHPGYKAGSRDLGPMQSYDLYDIILSHLIDEGYKELPSKRMADALVKKTIKSLTTLNRAKRERTSQQGLNVLNTMGSHDPTAAKAKSKYKTEETEIYDIILSHLIDEGYANTIEAAERIMVNMSEEWRESIVETRMDPRGRPASGPMNVYANPKGKPSQARLDAIAAVEVDNKKKTPEQRKKELDDYRERQMNNK